MTRFLMTLEDSVGLVIHAFRSAKQGDIFVQKAPACTVKDLAQALKEIFKSDSNINLIGTRHGEKLYESLLSREEMRKAFSTQRYFQVPMDDRDLNYNKYYIEGEISLSNLEDYTSHNTNRLSIAQIKKILINLPFIKDKLND